MVKNEALLFEKEKKSNKTSVEAALMFSGTELNFLESPDVPELLIPIDEVVERKVNEFADVPVDTLKVSIESVGLINPITVVKKKNDKKYTISAGHRRYKAICELHREYPEDERFETILARTFEVTDDPELLKQGGKYITEQQESIIYTDSNLQNRQLSYADALSHIDHIIEQIDTLVEEKEKALEIMHRYRKNAGIESKREKGINRAEFVAYILSNDLGYKGWKKETVRRYLAIKEEAENGNKNAIELMERVKEKDEKKRISVRTAYFMLTGEEKTSKTTIKSVGTSLEKIINELDEGRKLSPKEIQEVISLQNKITAILQANAESK